MHSMLAAFAAFALQDAPPPIASVAPTPSSKGITFQTGDFFWKLGGYVKVDVIHDFDEIGSTDTFDPRTIPTTDDGEPSDRTRIHARQSRINLEVKGPTTAGEMRAFIEGDFFGDNSSFR